MKLTINSKDLLKALQTVGAVIKPQNAMPVLENVLCLFTNNKLQLIADNLEVRSCIDVDVTFEGEHSLCAPYSLLSNILKGLPNTPIDLVLSEKLLKIQSSTGEYSIPLVPEDVNGYPVSQIQDAEDTITVNSLDFTEALNKTTTFIASDETVLSNVLFWIGEHATRVVGGTQFVMMEYTIPVTGREQKLVLTPSSANYFKSTISADENLEISYTKNMIFVKLEKRIISAVLVESKYPSYELNFDRIVTDKVYNIDKPALLPVVKRIMNVSQKSTSPVKFLFAKSKLELSSKHDTSEFNAKESIDVDYNGEDLEISMRASNVNAVLSNIEGDIQMKFSQPVMPCMVTADNARCIIMPMR
jgi:DNA polymerase III sliding clamp (beta) subunit (PCNA family)